MWLVARWLQPKSFLLDGARTPTNRGRTELRRVIKYLPAVTGNTPETIVWFSRCSEQQSLLEKEDLTPWSSAVGYTLFSMRGIKNVSVGGSRIRLRADKWRVELRSGNLRIDNNALRVTSWALVSRHFPCLSAAAACTVIRPGVCQPPDGNLTFQNKARRWRRRGRRVLAREEEKKRRTAAASDLTRSKKVLMSTLEAHRWFLAMTKWLSPVCSAAISRSIAHGGAAPLDNGRGEDGKWERNKIEKEGGGGEIWDGNTKETIAERVCACWFSRSYVEFKDALHVLNEILTQTPQNRSFYFPQEHFTSFKKYRWGEKNGLKPNYFKLCSFRTEMF